MEFHRVLYLDHSLYPLELIHNVSVDVAGLYLKVKLKTFLSEDVYSH